MTRPAEGGGSQSTISQLEPLFTEFVDAIGQLAGNEAALRVIKQQQEGQRLEEGWSREVGYFTFPGTYGFSTTALYIAMDTSHPDFDSDDTTNAEREKAVQDSIDEVWHSEHESWTGSAVAAIYRSNSQNVWEPDPQAMIGPVGQLESVIRWINDQLKPGAGWSKPGSNGSPEWLGELQRNWPATSRSASTFYEFWDDVNDKCALYLNAAARLAATSAQVTSTIINFQENLVDAAEAARDGAVQALKQWQMWKDDSGAWPTGEYQDNSKVKDILGKTSTITGILGAFPTPAGPALDRISLATDLANYAIPEKEKIYEIRSAKDASTFHNSFLADLGEIETTMGVVLDGLQSRAPEDDSPTGSQSFSSLAGDIAANRSDWRPLEVQL